MGDVTTLHSQARKLILQIREGLEVLEAVESGAKYGDSITLAKDLRAKHAELQRISSDLESVWRMFVMREAPAKLAVWKGKVEQVVEEVSSIRRALDKYGSREQRRAAEKADREELFARAEAGRRARSEVELEAQMVGSVSRSKRALEEIYESGTHILSNMSSNRERLKAAQRKMLDVLNSVGLGETLLKLIERRQRMDIWMTYAGMVLTLLIVVLTMWIFWK